MSDIRFNQWLHNSGTGGISQDSAGHVGIGTTVPTHINALTNNNSILHVGIVSCNTLNAASKIEGSIDDWIIHQSDTNTKFGFPTTDTFAVETAGDERVRITSGGQVNIGGNYTQTSNTLNVTGNIKSTTRFNAGDAVYLWSQNRMSLGNSFIIESQQDTPFAICTQGVAQPIVFGTGTAGGAAQERLRITSSGQVRIANTDLTADSKADDLIVGTTSNHHGITIFSGTDKTGNIYFADTSTSASGNRMGTITYNHSDGTDANYMRFSTAGNQERVRINSTGQLELRKNQDGVTGRPDNRIVFKDTDTSVAADQPIGEISWYSTDAGMVNVNSYIRGINEATNGSGALLFGVKAAGSSEIEAMRISSAGKVGIGTHTIDRDLEVYNSGGQTAIGIEGGTNTSQCSLWFMKPGDGNIGGIYYLHGSDDTQGFHFRANDQQVANIKGSGILKVENNISGAGHTAGVHIFKSSGSNDDHAELAVGYDRQNCYVIKRKRNSGTIQLNATQSGAQVHHEYMGTARWIEYSAGLIGTHPGGGGNFNGRWRYTQLSNQGTNYEYHILGPDGGTLKAYTDNNVHGIIWVGLVGTGTPNAYCQYRFSNRSAEDSLTLTHIAGGSSANSNIPYIVANSNNPAWKMNHSGSYSVIIDVMVIGGKSGNGTYTAYSYTANP